MTDKSLEQIVKVWFRLHDEWHTNAGLLPEDKALYLEINEAIIKHIRPVSFSIEDTQGDESMMDKFRRAEEVAANASSKTEAIKPEIEDSIREAVERALVETADGCFHEWGKEKPESLPSSMPGEITRYGKTCLKCGEYRLTHAHYS